MSGMQHFDHELTELDRQIVRLGNLCGLDMLQDKTVLSILEDKTKLEHFSKERQKPFLLLKGLLTLRYMVEQQCIDDIGTGDCKQVLSATLLK
ncbi:MAG: hypothetical protein CVU29_08500 [Betaproteobacteria bacterium HGW-Betaproteobacteria-22]|nr:MAG: hypothetical protein CVU29_08500 [Betaproteobacteria bacterium HGW-Betaproteobacteria-22]